MLKYQLYKFLGRFIPQLKRKIMTEEIVLIGNKIEELKKIANRLAKNKILSVDELDYVQGILASIKAMEIIHRTLVEKVNSKQP